MNVAVGSGGDELANTRLLVINAANTALAIAVVVAMFMFEMLEQIISMGAISTTVRDSFAPEDAICRQCLRHQIDIFLRIGFFSAFTSLISPLLLLNEMLECVPSGGGATES